MEISPGVELVWGLAGRETVAAQMKEITPDHFFCALLKFAEITNDDLKLLTPVVPVVQQLGEERNRVAAILTEREISSISNARRLLRRVLGKGSSNPPDDQPLHRSDASRQLFKRASQTAGPGPVEAGMLLRVLLDNPTPAMVQVLTLPAQKPRETTDGDENAVAASPYARNLSRSTASAPPFAKPQIDVLTDALRSARPTPILLICDPAVKILPIVADAARANSSECQVIGIDLVAMQRDEPDLRYLGETITRLLGDAPVGQGRALYFDTTASGSTDPKKVLQALIPHIAVGGPRVLVAVRTDTFDRLIADDPDLDEAFRLIWIHDLSAADIPVEL